MKPSNKQSVQPFFFQQLNQLNHYMIDLKLIFFQKDQKINFNSKDHFKLKNHFQLKNQFQLERKFDLEMIQEFNINH